MKKITFLLTLFISFSLYETKAQEWLNFSTEDGFPTNNIYQMNSDNDQSIWMSTEGDGIIRCKDMMLHNQLMMLWCLHLM